MALATKSELTAKSTTKLFFNLHLDRTIMNTVAEDKTVNASQNAEFPCEAVTDEQEKHNLKYTWRKDGRIIDFQREGRLSMNVITHALIITGAQVEDSAEYTCTADNGLDSAEVKATLVVKGKSSHCLQLTTFWSIWKQILGFKDSTHASPWCFFDPTYCTKAFVDLIVLVLICNYKCNKHLGHQ